MNEKMKEIEKRLKEIGNKIPDRSFTVIDVNWLMGTVQDQIKVMQDLSEEFDARFANHKLIRSDLEAKLDHAWDEIIEVENDRKYMRDKLIKQQELLEHYKKDSEAFNKIKESWIDIEYNGRPEDAADFYTVVQDILSDHEQDITE